MNATLKPYLTILSILTVASAAGCQQGVFRAGSLPPEFVAPGVVNPQQLDLARLSSSQGGSDRIHAGDVLLVTVVTGIQHVDEHSSWMLQVSEEGMADVPLVGPVQVAGLKPQRASLAVREVGIQRGVYRNPRVTIQIDQKHTKSVTVMGAVEEPGVYQLPATDCDLVAALAAAGGLSEEANTVVEVRRPTIGPNGVVQASYSGQPNANPMQVQRIDLVQAAYQGNAGLPLDDGAVVMVGKQQKRLVYVMGLVNESKQVEMPTDSEMRLLDALASAGGRTMQIADKVTVTRQHPRGGPSILIQASVREAQRSSVENIRLAPGDVVKVEETPTTFILGTVQNFIRFGFSAGVPGL